MHAIENAISQQHLPVSPALVELVTNNDYSQALSRIDCYPRLVFCVSREAEATVLNGSYLTSVRASS